MVTGVLKPLIYDLEPRTDFVRVSIRPLERERSALVGLHLMDAAAVIVRQIDAGTIGMAFEHQRLSIWRDVRLIGDEIVLAHAEIRRDPGDLPIRHADDPVLDPATRPATLAFKINQALQPLRIPDLQV